MLSTFFSNPILFLLWVLGVLIALSVHEFSHALVSTLLGDQTAKRMGRLTLNPASHVDPLGVLMLVLVGFGWGKPVPFNPYNLRNQRWGPVLVALAGPGMNLLMTGILALVFRGLLGPLGSGNLLIQFLYLSMYLNLGLLVFNLIPIPPLDGSKLLLATLSGAKAETTRIFLETRGPLILLGLVLADTVFQINVFGWLGVIVERLIGLLTGGL